MLFEQVNRFRPDFLYSCTTPLRQLAEFIRRMNLSIFRPERIITTAEMMDAATRKLLEDTFKSEVYDFYGLTEMGLVGWECPEHNGYHLAEDCTIVEYLPIQNGGDSAKLVMTNLDLVSMPFIRFETGDVGMPGSQEPCPCGRSFSRLERVEGRIVDCVQLQDGQRISPYKLTGALERLQGIERYQVIQEDYGKFTIKVKTGKKSVPVADSEIRAIMRSVLGNEITVTVRKHAEIDPEPGEKFRIVASRLPKDDRA